MSDSKRFLHPEAIQRISRLELRARQIVEGYLSGRHRSPKFGQSIEFRQHREYAPGDDLRHVDWKVWARQDRMYIKQYEEDTNSPFQLLVDASASMRYGNGPLNKYEYACTIAASLGYLALRQQDAVGCTLFDDEIRMRIPPRTRRTHLRSIVDAFDVADQQEKTDLYQVLRRAAELEPRRGMMVLVSDLLTDRDAVIRGLKMLRQRGHDVLVFHVMDVDELDFDFTGATQFDGMESDDLINCNPRALRDGYLEALNRFLDDLRHGCARNQIDYTLVRTSEPMDSVLTAFLNRRSGRQTRS